MSVVGFKGLLRNFLWRFRRMKSAMHRDWGVVSRESHCNVHDSASRPVPQLPRANRMVMACMCLAEERAQHAVPLQEKGKTLDAAGCVGEVEPDFYTA